MKESHRKFSPEFKQEAVDLVRRTGKSSNQVAQELGIGQTCLSRWMRKAQASPGEDNVFATHAALRRLRKEVEHLKMERDILKKATVRSMGQCNAIIEDTRWGAESQCLSWALIQAQSDPIQVPLREAGEVRTFREILPQQAICVFVGATLPRALRIAEIDLHAGGDTKVFMLGQFHPSIPGQ